jgi:ribonuclease P protein component
MAVVERLKRRPEFLRVAGARRKWVAAGLILQADRRIPPGEGASDGLRVGFTVSRKVGNAVARNRARRRLRAAAALVLPRCAAPGHDYVIVGRAATLTRTFAGLTEDLEAGLRRLGLWRDDVAPAGTEER